MKLVINDPKHVHVVKSYSENTGLQKFIKKDGMLIRHVEIESLFQKLGLSKNEIQVYVYLARSMEQKASEISEALSFHRTETYRILRDLEKQGLVSSVFEKPLKFIAIPFECAVDTLIEAKKLRIRQLERKKRELVEVWRSFPQPIVEYERKEVFQILEGEEQIDLKAIEIVKKAKKEIKIFTSEEDLARFYHSGLFDLLDSSAKRNYNVKLLTYESPKNRFFIEKTETIDVRFALSEAKDMPTFILSDQEYLLLTIGKYAKGCYNKTRRVKISALWTNYGAFAKITEKLFSGLWNVGESLQTAISPSG
ncbi:MAG: TrmB family transcriptional regulator [Candidatus Bathyarchaeota archaeon]|nr:MAG: TrmB family transcriptional regulator [Candidatus Bathyarchaeota archaeon]